MAEEASEDPHKGLLAHSRSQESVSEASGANRGPRSYESHSSLADTLYSPTLPVSPSLSSAQPQPGQGKSSPPSGLGITNFGSGRKLPGEPFMSLSSVAKQPELKRGGTGINRPKNSPRAVSFLTDSFPNTPGLPSFPDNETCASEESIWRSRRHWSTVVLLLFSLFSTTFSGIYLGIAFVRPVWPSIRPDGSLSPQGASVLQIAFAKLIEISFVTVFCAFVGQVVSRRAFMTQHGAGINLAEVNIRQWLTQPGSIISHPHIVRYAIWSVIGVLSMVATICALLYTTAAESLVSPQLLWDDWSQSTIHGEVKASFGNRYYVGTICSPLSTSDDWNDKHNTCLQIQHGADSYSNFQQYKNLWPRSSNASISMRKSDATVRPPGIAKFSGDISVTGSWVEQVDVSKASSMYGGRIINNVTLAIPHPGVVSAAKLSQNNIPVPKGPEQIDNFQINASLPSPALYVLCASATAEELKPLVWEEWAPDNKISLANGATYSRDFPAATFNTSQPYSPGYNKTALDAVFNWGPDHNGTGRRYPPLFPKLPKVWNSVLNATGIWGNDAIYVLFNTLGAEAGSSTPPEFGYAVCSMKVGWVPYCSTHYSATGNGGTMETVCEDENDAYRYNKVHPEVGDTWGQSHISGDWRNIASEWANALSFNQGINDANASSVHLLSQLMPQITILDDSLPSLAESLAVLSTGTVLMSAQDTSFSGDWPYDQTMFMSQPKMENMTAAVRVQRYASRPTSKGQEAFILVLLFVFVANTFILFWFLFFHRGLVTDYTEPSNLFSLSINSPPSRDFAGACGGGPNKKQYRVRWFINADGEHVYLKSRDPGTPDPEAKLPRFRFKRIATDSPMSAHVDRLSRQRWSML